MSHSLSPVVFHDDTIFCVTIDNQPFAPVKPIVENMGLDWMGQYRKLTDKRERWGIEIISIPSDSGDQQTLCLPVRKLPAFLASINPKKVRTELRAKIELYQAECDDALWNYWTKGQATRAAQPSSIPCPLTPSTAADRKPLRSLVNAWSVITTIPHTALWAQVRAHFQLERIDDLPLEWIPDALDFVQGKIDGAQKVLPPASEVALITRPRHTPGPVEHELAILLEELQAFGEGFSRFNEIMNRAYAVASPVYKQAWHTLGWQERSGFSLTPLTEGMNMSYWQSMNFMQEALAQARRFMGQYQVLARLQHM